jgi:multicomponent Na+:H+ antiporter subunit G
MIEIISHALIIGGSLFIVLAGIGVLRMPDLYMRLSTVTKGATMGVGMILAAALLELFTVTVLIKVAAVLAFGLVTSPVAAHMISRAAYFQGVSLWEGTVVDELKGQYTMRDHELAHPPEESVVATSLLGDPHANMPHRDHH